MAVNNLHQIYHQSGIRIPIYSETAVATLIMNTCCHYAL
nr:MAG TPA: early protein [Crassvirales sp.]